MGCVGSKRDLDDKHPNVFRVINVDRHGEELWTGHIEVTSVNLTLYRKHKPPTQWPLQCLRRYGYESDTFSFEAGRRCLTGQGIYSFRCRRAEQLFQVLQQYIHVSTYNNNNMNNNNNNNTLTVRSLDEVVLLQEGGGGGGGVGTDALLPMTPDETDMSQHTRRTMGSNYIFLHGGSSSGGIISQSPSMSISPNGTLNSLSQHDNTNNDRNHTYLEPLAGSDTNAALSSRFAAGNRLSSIGSGGGVGGDNNHEPTATALIMSPDSPHSISMISGGTAGGGGGDPATYYTNGVMVNVYHELTLATTQAAQDRSPLVGEN